MPARSRAVPAAPGQRDPAHPTPCRLPQGFAAGPAAHRSRRLAWRRRPAGAPPVASRRAAHRRPSTGAPRAGPAGERHGFDRAFVVEIEEDGSACACASATTSTASVPAAGTAFTATYRVGNGGRATSAPALDPRGSSSLPGLAVRSAVRNPLPARGGVEPESLEDGAAPRRVAFRAQQRAVTRPTTQAVAERHPEVQRAAATFRWTGSWYTVFVTVDRLGGCPWTPPSRRACGASWSRSASPATTSRSTAPTGAARPRAPRLRRAGPLPQRREGGPAAGLRHRPAPDGRRGFFHPDNFTFGQPVYLSRIYAAAAEVAGVAAVAVKRFQRWGRPARTEIQDGVLPVGRLEIAELANDPNFQENGRLQISMGGGK